MISLAVIQYGQKQYNAMNFLDKLGRPNSVHPATKYLTNGPWIYMVPQFKPKDVLILGFAGGTVAGLIKLIYGDVPITAVDIEECPNFYEVELIQADAREYVKTSRHFDVVIVDLLCDKYDAYDFMLGREFVSDLKRIANYVIVNTANEADMGEYRRVFGRFGSNKPNRLSNRIYYYGTRDYNDLIIR